jgi:hypothetical protein
MQLLERPVFMQSVATDLGVNQDIGSAIASSDPTAEMSTIKASLTEAISKRLQRASHGHARKHATDTYPGPGAENS